MSKSDLEMLLPAGINSLKDISERKIYAGTEYQEETIKVRDNVIDALQKRFNEKKRSELYLQSCDVVQRTIERNNILDWVQRCKEKVIGEGEVHIRSNNVSNWKTMEYPVEKYKKEDVIKQYSTLVNILEDQIIPKGIDGYERKRLKYINKILDIFQEDPIIFDMGSISLLPKDGKFYEQNI